MNNILVIEDDAHVRGILRVILEAEGYGVIEAANIRQGIAALELKPDAIFADVEMPGGTGASFAIELRQHPTQALTPLTFVTEHTARVQHLADGGLSEKQIIGKPFKREVIRQAASQMLGTLKRRNLRVSLVPGLLKAEVDGKEQGPVMRLSDREIHLRLKERLSSGDKHSVSLRSGHHLVSCQVLLTRVVQEEARLSIVPDRTALMDLDALMRALLADAHAREDVRDSERFELAASVSWERNGSQQNAYLRDLSSSGAYIVSTTRPDIGETVMVYLPWHPQGGAAGVRGAEAKIMRHGNDGFGCRFIGGDTGFFVALNALLSDGAVVSGETSL